LHKGEKYAEAVQAYDQALASNGAPAEAHRGRAEVLMSLQDYAEAVRSFDRYLEKGPASAAVYRLRGLARAKLADHVGAIADYKQALTLEPGAESNALTHAQLGWAFLACETPTQALRHFTEAVRLDPKNGDAHHGLGLALVKLGQPSTAVGHARKAIQLGPPTAQLLYGTARIFAVAVEKLDAQRGTSGQARWEYQDQALLLLDRALQALPTEQRAQFWREVVAGDSAFASIRKHAPAEYQRRAPPGALPGERQPRK
jgi:tetratricopeptide (TPR) repeat protein